MRPLPGPDASALRSTVRSPVTTKSGAVFPSPNPLIGSLDVTLTIWQSTEASQISVTSTLITTGRSLWLRGQRLFGSAVAAPIVGAVVSTTVTVVIAVLTLPASSSAVNVTTVTPRGNTPGESLVMVTSVSQLSVAVGSGTTTGVPARLVCSTTIGAGTLLRNGSSLSRSVFAANTSSLRPAVKLAARASVQPT